MTLAVQFTHVSRQFGEVKAVDRVSIDIQDGEFFSMLGPSGSGKTTCLRLIAGFEQPSDGSIRIHGADRGLPHVLVELRQDLIDTHHGAADWSDRFARALETALAEGMPYKIQAPA